MKESEHRSLRLVEDTHWFYRGKREIAFWWLDRLESLGLLARRDARLLDIGCGSGVLMMGARPMKAVMGIEISPLALQALRDSVRGMVTQASALELPLASRSMDVVTCFDVIEHLEDDSKAVEEIFRVLRPKGWVMINVPAYQWLWSDWDEIHGHYRRYNRPQLRKLLEGAGFRVHYASYENFTGFFPAILVRMVRRILGNDRLQVENRIPRPLLNSFLKWTYTRPARGFSKWFPLGLSVWVVARKPDVA